MDLETKQKKGHHLARNGIRVRQQTIFMYKQSLGQTKKASHFEVDLETKQKKSHHLARNGIRVRQQTIFFYVQTLGQTKKASHF